METTTQAATKVRFTTEDYHRMGEMGLLDPDRTHELIDGETYRMAPQSYDHASRTRRIANLFRKRIGKKGLDWADYVKAIPSCSPSTTSRSRMWRCCAASRATRRARRTFASSSK